MKDIYAWAVNQKLCMLMAEFPFLQDYDSHFDSIFLTNTMSGAVLPYLSSDFPSFSENSLDCVYLLIPCRFLSVL